MMYVPRAAGDPILRHPTTSHRHTAGLAAALALATLALMSCAKVHHYEARPLLVCPSQPVNLAWKVSGSATLSAEPETPDITPGPVRDKGTKTVHLSRSTTLILKVKHWFGSPVINRQQVTVVEKPETQTIGETTSCGDNEVIARVQRDMSELSPLLRVATVTLADGLERDVVVEHAGKTVTLTPAAPSSNALDGTAPGGAWTLRSRLLEGEACGEISDQPPPEVLFIDVRLECTPQ